MKSPLLPRLAAFFRVSSPKRRKGVAILTVLAIITLMTVLVISFFNMAQTAKTTAKGSVEIQRVTTLKDTIINIVIAQFREASKLAPASASNPRQLVTWVSQPGAIRTFSATDVSKTKLFKLYSSDEPQIDSIQTFDTPSLLDSINKDLAPDWATRPDEFTDINRPVYTAASGDRASATGATDQKGFSYPIADPRRFDGGTGVASSFINTEGFSYGPNSRGKVIEGVDAQKAQLAMPVRWIYMLQDGTLGFLDESQEFKPLTGDISGDVSRQNPIVGRLAWWADDESCKVNVNTASVPAAWDTPRTTSQEDVLLGQRQPIAGEFQRYPGHPATVDLCAVFHPGYRWTPYPAVAPPGGNMRALDLDDAVRIWDVCPFIVGDQRELRSGGDLGTLGGSRATPQSSVAAVGASPDDRIFTSLDEVYFKATATGSASSSLSKPRENLGSLGSDRKGEFLATLQQSQFFLTHKSHSPELTNQGYPRVSMYPMDLRANAEIGKPLSAALASGVSPYDVTVAVNTTIGRKPYYFQREVSQAGSRHNEMFQTVGGRNALLFKYLKELSKLPIPGYPEAVRYELKPGLSAVEEPSDAAGLSFSSKYPPARRPGTKLRFSNSNRSGADPTDASDRTQILWNMLDYTRSINTNSAFLATDKYDDGYGQASAVCGCRGLTGTTGADHSAALAFSEKLIRTPKGTGKRHGIAEIVMILNVAGKMDPSGVASGDWAGLVGQLDAKSARVANPTGSGPAGTRYIVEVGFFVSTFSPKHGWSAQFPSGGIAISSIGSAGDDPRSGSGTDTNTPLPMSVIVGTETEKLSVFRGAGGANIAGTDLGSGVNGISAASRKLPPNVIPWGGMSGPRGFFPVADEVNSIAICRPFCISNTDGSTLVEPQILTSGDPTNPIRIMLYDGNVNAFNVIQAIDVILPVGFASGMRANFQPTPSGTSLRRLAKFWGITANGTTPSNPAAVFPPPGASLRSLVVPHGDYRLVTTPLRVDGDIFVPHVNAMNNLSQRAHSMFENTTNPRFNSFVSEPPPGAGPGTPAYGLVGALMDRKFVDRYPSPRDPSTNLVFASIPPAMPDPAQMVIAAGRFDPLNGPSSPSFRLASRSLAVDPVEGMSRRQIFSHGRLDGQDAMPLRGSSDPTETSDFDNGIGLGPDGPYMNYPDEGDRRQVQRPYFDNLANPPGNAIPVQRISPNFLVRSPVDFGSIPTGIQARVPWQTLRFRPDPLLNNLAVKMKGSADEPPAGLPFANFCGPKDHFFLDMFWMPVVEPWSISEPFSTKGTINLNQQILPFLYIERTTALHALLRGERMLAIPNEAAGNYKKPPQFNQDATYRHFINAKETIRQFTKRYNEGQDVENQTLAFNVFRSASEICEMWLVPEKNGNVYDGNEAWTLEYVSRRQQIPTQQPLRGFWDEHLPTGDNSRERPYANLYPRVTVRSNVFKLHLVAQTLQKATSENPKTFDSVKDSVTAEWRGSCIIERSINPSDPALVNVDYTNLNAGSLNPTTTPKLDRFYTYRVTEVKQLTQ